MELREAVGGASPATPWLGRGEMAERIRAFDWARTPLGPAERWPQSLCTAVRILLGSRYPMFVWWGRELANLYNDAYVPVLGARHPAALGRSAPEVWSEIWDVVGPQAEAVMREGRATWNERVLLVMERNRFLEETYFTFSYSPAPDDEGRVGGVFCACTEDTQLVLGERRLRTLRALAEQAPLAPTPEAACAAAAATLAEDPWDVPFALLYLLDRDGRRATLAGGTALPAGARIAPERVDLDGDGPLPFARVAASGRAEELDASPERFGPLPGGAWPEPPRRALVLPMTRPGSQRLAGFVVAGLSPRLVFDDGYRGFLELVAGQVATAVAHARGSAEERRRAASLAELDRAKTLFFSNVSHELRTPLALVLGPVEELLAPERSDVPADVRRSDIPADPERSDLPADVRRSDLPADVRAELEVVRRNGRRLLRLVNSLLDFSAVEAGRARADYRATDLAALTADLASNFRSACERAGIGLEVECAALSAPVWVDREHWEKIVLNLVSNAFKFTFEGGIRVTVGEEAGQAVLRVADTGVGIPAAELPRVFERFHRVEGARGRTHEGTGIGLALVQELVKLHGGRADVESTPGLGTVFTVRVPLGTEHLDAERLVRAAPDGGSDRAPEGASSAVEAAAWVEEALRWLPDALPALSERSAAERGQTADEPAGEPAAPSGRARVLIADDNADMRAYVRRLLEPRHDVVTAASGVAVLALARRDPPDLVLCDVMMPGLDGFAVLRALRAEPRTRAVPVLLVSARAGEEARLEGLAAGADDYLVKPFGARELTARVDAHLALGSIRRAGETLFRTMADTAPAMLRVTDAANRCTFISRTWCEHTGQTEADGLGTGWLEAVHPDDRERTTRTFLAAAERREPFRLDYRLRAADGGWRWALDAGRPRLSPAGELEGYVGAVIDVHDRQRAEEALRTADRRKDEFLALLAHELRNPLAALTNALSLLDLDADGRATLDYAREIMGRQLGTLVRLIDDLLDVSRISRGKLELRRERVELGGVLRRVLDAARPVLADRELEVSIPSEPLLLDADPVRLTQVFDNLLANAAKFTDPGGAIAIAVERADGEVVVTVRDDGVGMSPEELEGVFELFVQAQTSVARSRGGLGIGLTLVRRLVELHGGGVSAHSAGAGRGSELVVRLPLAPADADADSAEPAAAPGPAARPPGLRVLVVDDNVDAAESLALLLEAEGHVVSLAHDGEEALRLAAESPPDAVLLDIGLPKLDGYGVARRMRASPGGEHVLLVAVTGWGQAADKRRTAEAGFDHHLVKPVDLGALLALIAELAARAVEPRG